MQDKIAWLMEAVGCEREQAELALAMCRYDLEKAVRAIPHLLKNIIVVKGRFEHRPRNQFGLILVVLDLRSRSLARARAVISYNPAVYGVPLDKGWFEFEKHLYACRLWEGSLQAESQEIEAALTRYFRGSPVSSAFEPAAPSADALSAELSGLLEEFLSGGAAPALELKKELLDLGEFQLLQGGAPGSEGPKARTRTAARAKGHGSGPLVLSVALEEDPGGAAASQLRAGDIVAARITDRRDIASYLSKILGGYSEEGPRSIAAPVEAVEAASEQTSEAALPRGKARSAAPEVTVRVRLAMGVCGDAALSADARVKTLDAAREKTPWWKRFFG